MMRYTFSALLTASILTLPSLAGAQPQPPQPPVPPRVTVERARPAQQRDNRAEHTERLTHTFRIGASGELDVQNLTGDIIVTRGRGNDIEVEAIKTARARTAEEARSVLATVRVAFAERGGRGEVRAIYPREHYTANNRRNTGVSVAYNITAPEGTRINVKSLTGNVKVTGIKGDLSVVSTTGDVNVFNAARLAVARSTSGNVQITDLRSELPLELHSTSGDLTVRQSRVPRLELSTVTGTLVIDDVQVEQLEAQSLTGNLELSFPFSRSGRYDLNSHSGDIRVVVTGGSGFELDANSFSGTINSSLELQERTGSSGDGNRGGRTRRLRGVFGDGRALLDITTFSGNVTITKK